MRTEYFLFFCKNTSILAKLITCCLEESGDISCFLLVNPSHTDASCEGGNTCLLIYILNLFIENSGEHWWEQNILCSFTATQAFQESSAPGAWSTLVTSVVLYELTQATLMRPGKDETRFCGYILWIFSLSNLENTDENRIFFVLFPHHKYFSKAQQLLLWALWCYQLFSPR